MEFWKRKKAAGSEEPEQMREQAPPPAVPTQTERIIAKVPLASRKDNLRKVFGASSHKYALKEPLSPETVEAFERKHGISLPQELTDFLTLVGNGGAGPHYGIYPLEEMEEESARLAEPCLLRPDFTLDEWRQLDARCEEQAEEEDDQAYAAAGERMFQGTLCIGTQGCTYDTVLVLNGPYRGRIAYIDRDYQQPFFTYEENFLNWYERWLDELLAGYNVDSFGKLRHGGEEELFALFDETDDEDTRFEAIRGLFKLPSLQPDTIARLRIIFREAEPFSPLAHMTMRHLASVDFPYVEADTLYYIRRGPESADRQAAARLISTYMPAERLRKWLPSLIRLLHGENDSDAFFSLLMLLEEAEALDFDVLRPLFAHPEAGIRSKVFYAAGKLPDKARHVDVLREGLLDPDTKVRLYAVQALRDVADPELLPLYGKLLQEHAERSDHIVGNVMGRLQEFGDEALPLLRETALSHPNPYVKEEARQILERRGAIRND
ncbi:HEAT repeat domain-containing protein [Saccharibacillus alkalitolerans]|uniref:SMI1/KNR4 family protein n=1 Tax=Saccharibacillus alkalitolerans TaxID=2705290 RepID=A0ABX0FAF0_9BACL|nr:HEAT repeat domain-containing protein [Saccharibacillus alkalitolerans]NGZ76935.1 SMI1/KNR4 family protein [Saccharibacillus alkalitolerans]